jgi:anti-sigma factor (TIGR02949 family)
MRASMTCRETIDLFMDFVEGSLSPEDKQELDRHFAACPPCLEFLRSYEATPRILKRAAAQKMPPEVGERLKRFLEKKRRS